MIRPVLRPPRPNPTLRRKLLRLARRITAFQNSGQPVADHIALFNRLAGSDLEPFDFHAAWEGDGEGQLVTAVLLPRPPYCPDVGDSELLEIITWVQQHPASRDVRWYISVLERHLPNPRISDLFFYADLTPPEILRRAHDYRPLITPPPVPPEGAA